MTANEFKDGLKKATENMPNPYFDNTAGAWGTDLDWIAGKGHAVRVYDCPENFHPVEDDEYPLEQWLKAVVSVEGYVFPRDGKKALKEIQKFLWDAFTDADAVGVKLDNLLSWPGLKYQCGLTQSMIDSVKAHYYKPEDWSKEDEKVRDIVAEATDSEDFEALYSWLAWAVGDQTAAGLVEDWESVD